MAQPPAYNRTHDFTLDESGEVDTGALNTEYDAASTSINKIRECLALLQNDDGSLKAGVIRGDALGKELTAAIDKIISDAEAKAQEALDAAQKAVDDATEAATTVTEEGTNQVLAVRKEGETQLSAVNQAGETMLNRIEMTGDQSLISAGTGSYEQFWTLSSAVSAGTNIAIPSGVKYIVGRHHLRVSWNGLVLFIGQNFSEVGATDTFSDTFRLTFDAKAGDEIDVWIGALGKGNTDEAIATAKAASDAVAELSRKVVYREETT